MHLQALGAGTGVKLIKELIAVPWTVAHWFPLSTGFSKQKYFSRLPFPPPGDLPNPGIEPTPLKSPALAGRLFTTSATWEGLSRLQSNQEEPGPKSTNNSTHVKTTSNLAFAKH